jgi:hypothetical protein
MGESVSLGSRSCEHSILTAVMKRTREMGSAMGWSCEHSIFAAAAMKKKI